jgi:hypothetical protein
VSDFDINFNVEMETKVKDRLASGYRGRRNYLVSELLGMIVYATPVKDGYARGGWYLAAGNVSVGGERPPDKDGSATIFSALASLRGSSAFKDVYIKNDVEYINDLERGSSKQAPVGMIRVSLSAFKSQYGDVE